jgi:DNA segregation ATPase FtsK/SpoIIIE, S-DNA-T family
LAGVKSTVGKHLDAARFHTLFHLIRAPKYLALAVVFAVVGVGRIAERQRRWWWLAEQSGLRTKAVLDGNSPEWRSLHTHARKVRAWRGAVLGAELFAVALVLVLVAATCPWWAWFVVAAIAVPPLAHVGRPAHAPIVQSAVTTPLVRKISTDAIVRAYERAGLCSTDPKKPADHLGFGSVMTRDALDKGSQVVIYLPYGGTFDAVVNAKTKIASGLDVAESQVYFTRDKQSERRHLLRVLDTDPLSEPAGRTPLLDCKQRSVWRKFPFGLDQFGRKVAFCLLWISLLIGAQPRRGKTFAGRLIALYCALDPYVDITLIDGKSSKDWQPLRYVAHRFIQGTHPTKDGDPV